MHYPIDTMSHCQFTLQKVPNFPLSNFDWPNHVCWNITLTILTLLNQESVCKHKIKWFMYAKWQNYWLGSLDTISLYLTNQNLLKVPKVIEPTNFGYKWKIPSNVTSLPAKSISIVWGGGRGGGFLVHLKNKWFF